MEILQTGKLPFFDGVKERPKPMRNGEKVDLFEGALKKSKDEVLMEKYTWKNHQFAFYCLHFTL